MNGIRAADGVGYYHDSNSACLSLTFDVRFQAKSLFQCAGQNYSEIFVRIESWAFFIRDADKVFNPPNHKGRKSKGIVIYSRAQSHSH